MLFCRSGPFKRRAWSTQVVDVAHGQLLDVVPGRDAASTCAWFAEQPAAWCAAIRWATLDLSGPYRSVFDTMLPHAVQIADPFHVVKLANFVLDETRRRVQNETCGHRGRKSDPLYRIRKLMTIAHERLDTDNDAKLRGLLAPATPPVRSAPPGTPKKWSARSTPSTTRGSRPSSLLSSASISRRVLPTRRCDAWGDLGDGDTTPPAIKPVGPTDPPGHQQHSRSRGRVRNKQLDELPDPSTALRRPTQLVTPQNSPLKSEAPCKWPVAAGSGS